jgi:hypothetical protein
MLCWSGTASPRPGAAAGTASAWSPRTGRSTYPARRTQGMPRTDSPRATRSSIIWNSTQPTCRCAPALRLAASSRAQAGVSCSAPPTTSSPRTRWSSAPARTSALTGRRSRSAQDFRRIWPSSTRRGTGTRRHFRPGGFSSLAAARPVVRSRKSSASPGVRCFSPAAGRPGPRAAPRGETS